MVSLLFWDTLDHFERWIEQYFDVSVLIEDRRFVQDWELAILKIELVLA